MLEKWSLTNFKSIHGKHEFALKHLTIFAGANSSGKSTLLQSMLVVAQTVTNQVPSRAVVLNGHIVRLGAFNDVVSVGKSDQPITIGFRYSAARSPLDPEVARGYMFDELGGIECEFSFAPPAEASSEELRQLYPEVQRCKVVQYPMGEGPPTYADVSLSSKSPEDRQTELGIDPNAVPGDVARALKYDVDVPEDDDWHKRYYGFRPASGVPVGASLAHFIPNRLAMKYDITQERAESMVKLLTGIDVHSPRGPHSVDDDPDSIPIGLRERVLEIAFDAMAGMQHGVRRPSKPWTAKKVAAAVGRLHSPKVQAAFQENFDELVELARDGNESVYSIAYVPALWEAQRALNRFFTDKFRYLGPLRDEPKAVYPLEGAVDPTHVGLRGEFTAAVLDLHKNTRIWSIAPRQFAALGLEAEPKQVRLQQAVASWLHYLGVVDKVETRDRGVFGHELQVSTNSEDSLHNLVHVGVGVSQVLPILVMSLLSPPGAVLIFEQPELHLHPSVQARLGDFFLSLTRTDRQCVVETHSEYLINRLRFRAAADSSDRTHDAFGLYFVEKHGTRSSYRRVIVNEFGAITDWPRGFFDQSPVESERILLAAMEKRQSRRRNDV